jgi:transcriptional regulator with XRE-family HTH domain
MPLERLIPYLAKSIKKRREELGLSHEQLAEKVGLSAEYIAFLESGGMIFSMKTLHTVADGLNYAPSELIESAERMTDLDKDSR